MSKPQEELKSRALYALALILEGNSVKFETISHSNTVSIKMYVTLQDGSVQVFVGNNVQSVIERAARKFTTLYDKE